MSVVESFNNQNLWSVDQESEQKMNLLKSPKISKDNALQLIRGMEEAEAKWIGFDGLVKAEARKSSKITEGSVIKALIIEASDLSLECDDVEGEKVKAICQDFRKETVDKVMKDLSEKDRQLVERKYGSIRSLISKAKHADEPEKGGDTPNKTGTGKTGLSGKSFQKIKEQLPPYLNSLSNDDLEAFWQIVNSAYTARKVEVQEHKKAS